MSEKGSYVADLRGTLEAGGKRFALVVSRFNGGITEELLLGARECLLQHGAGADDLELFRVPGAWELPQAAAAAARAGRFDAVIALGCVIRGETPHFEYLAAETARGLGAVARETGVAVSFGVLTTETEVQARRRADRGRGNKGAEAALAALELLHVLKRIESPDS
ncbi:MAG TPA: 6,7-dimethyl-8-ribityllumazine synthase [Longimicrobiales bacterium]